MWEIAAYYARTSNEILSMDDPNAPGNSLVTNIDKTTPAGLEALVGSSFAVDGEHRIDPRVSFTSGR
jgi:iron complex outermembrane receptor protein